MKNSKNDNSLSENSNYLLYNVANYKVSIDNSVTEILTKFVRVIVEYMRFISEKITMKNKQYYKFIFERGIETLMHIFSIIFYYTKNLELTFYHCQKAYYFYIEFIEQISDDNVTFLQLSSRDAILFVYKKTIFDLHNEYRKNIPEPTIEEKNILSIVVSNTYIYKNIVKSDYLSFYSLDAYRSPIPIVHQSKNTENNLLLDAETIYNEYHFGDQTGKELMMQCLLKIFLIILG
jgi:hypothetical protein